MPPYDMTKAEKQEMLISVWKLQFGYEWVEWDDAVAYRNSITGSDIMITDLIDVEIFERKNNYQLGEAVRLTRPIPSEPVSIMEDV